MPRPPTNLAKLQQNVAGLGQVMAGLDLWIAAIIRVVGVERVKAEAEAVKAEVLKQAQISRKKRNRK